MAVVIKTPQNLGNFTEVEDEEEEEDLFEIDLEAFDSIPPPRYYWGSYFTNNLGTALFANCLLPVSYVSVAVPVSPTMPVSNVAVKPVARRKDYCFSVPESVPLGKLLQLPYSRALQDYSSD